MLLKIDVVQDGGEVFFRIKSSATLRKLMNAYCERQSVDASSIAFLFDGRRLRAEQTPAEVLFVVGFTLTFLTLSGPRCGSMSS